MIGFSPETMVLLKALMALLQQRSDRKRYKSEKF
jgi:hypothetical protein